LRYKDGGLDIALEQDAVLNIAIRQHKKQYFKFEFGYTFA